MVAIGMFIISVGMMSGGRVMFSFFPTPEADIIIANFKMHSGTTRSKTEEMLNQVAALDNEKAALNTEILGLRNSMYINNEKFERTIINIMMAG